MIKLCFVRDFTYTIELTHHFEYYICFYIRKYLHNQDAMSSVKGFVAFASFLSCGMNTVGAPKHSPSTKYTDVHTVQT